MTSATRRTLVTAILGYAAAPRLVWAALPKPLEIGVLPNINARSLMAQYLPMRSYLESALRGPVQISTAPNWSAFHQRTQQQEYDLVVTAAHLARVAQLDFAYVPLLYLAPKIKAQLICLKVRPLTAIEELRGQALVMSNPQSLVALRGLAWLAENGLQRGVDFTTVITKTDDSVGNVLVRGEAIAAIISGGELRAVPEAIRSQLQIFTTFAEVPGFVVMASPKLSTDERAAMKTHLLNFAAGTEQAKAFFDGTGFTGMLEVPPGFMEQLDSFTDATRKLLSAPG